MMQEKRMKHIIPAISGLVERNMYQLPTCWLIIDLVIYVKYCKWNGPWKEFEVLDKNQWSSSGIPILSKDEESQKHLGKVDTTTKVVG